LWSFKEIAKSEGGGVIGGFQVLFLPDGHARTRNGGQLDGPRETLVTLRIIVLEADLKFDGFEEVSLLLVEGVIE
jgi:hypothetical protein